MAPPIQYFTKGEDWVFPEELDLLFEHETVMLEVCYPITWGGKFQYPYPEIQRLIRSLRDRFSASKLVWGSDMPNVERFCTYKQSIDYIRFYCDFLPASEMALILGGNISDLLKIDQAL
jgi:predicted TIM-barrel fold metal-dependent hydrolase